MVNTNEYISYFRTIATNNKAIAHTNTEKHFYRIDISEVLEALRSDINYPALLLENHSGQIIDALSDNPKDSVNFGFAVVKAVDNRTDNYTDVENALSACHDICRQIISKMWKDAKRQDTIVQSIDLNTVTYEKVGPVFDNCYGYRVSGSIIAKADIYFNTAEWNNEQNVD